MLNIEEEKELGVTSSNKKGNTTTYKTSSGTDIVLTANRNGKWTKLVVGRFNIMFHGLDDKEIVDAILQGYGDTTKETNIKMSAKDLKNLMHYDKKAVETLLQREKDLTKGSGKFVVFAPKEKKFLSEKKGLTKDNLKVGLFDTKEDALKETDNDLVELVVVEI
jgi:hypothetical protein